MNYNNAQMWDQPSPNAPREWGGLWESVRTTPIGQWWITSKFIMALRSDRSVKVNGVRKYDGAGFLIEMQSDRFVNMVRDSLTEDNPIAVFEQPNGAIARAKFDPIGHMVRKAYREFTSLPTEILQIYTAHKSGNKVWVYVLAM